MYEARSQGIVWRRRSRFQFPIFQRSRADDRKNPHAKRIKVHDACVWSIKLKGRERGNFREDDGVCEVLPDLSIVRRSHIAHLQPFLAIAVMLKGYEQIKQLAEK